MDTEQELNEKQLQIMTKALEVFSEKGFDATSVRDIAQSADVNVAMISYYFGSKEKLLEAIFLNRIGSMKARIESIIHSRTHDPMQKVDLLIDNYIDVIVENRTFHLLMMREQVLLKEGKLYGYIRDMKQQNRTLIEVAVKAGQKSGIFQKNIDVSMLAMTFFGSINHFFSTYRYVCDSNTSEQQQETDQAEALEKLKNHLKVMFKAFLTYGISNKK